MPSFFFFFAFHRHGEGLAQIGVREGRFAWGFCKCGGWKCLFRRCGGASQVVFLQRGGGAVGRWVGLWVGGSVGWWVGGSVGEWVGVFSRGHRHSLTHSLVLFFLSRARVRALSLSRARAHTHTHTQCQGPRAYGLKSR